MHRDSLYHFVYIFMLEIFHCRVNEEKVNAALKDPFMRYVFKRRGVSPRICGLLSTSDHGF